MIIAPLHPREAERLSELRALRLLDTPREAGLDALAEAARLMLGMEQGLVTLVDADRQWFKACAGPLQTGELARENSFCAHAILGTGPMMVPDAQRDPRFADNPLVTGPPFIRSYAGVPIHGPNGLPVGTLCTISDKPRPLGPEAGTALAALARAVEVGIDHRRRRILAEARLREANLGFDAILESVPDGVAIIDPRGGITALNAAMLALPRIDRTALLAGPRPGEALLARLAEGGLLGGGDPAARLAEWQAALAAGERRDHLGEAGEAGVLHCLARPIPGGGVLLLLREMDPLLKAEAEARELRQANALLRRAIEASPAGIAVADARAPDWPLVYVNPAFSRITGWRAEEVVGRSSRFLRGPGSDPAAARAMRQAMAEDRESRTEMLAYRRDGSEIWLDFLVAPVAGEDGRAQHFIAVQNDITAHRRLVEELETARIAAEAASRAKSDFLASMSHEIRTPLNGIIGMTTLLLASELDPEQRRFTQGALQSGELLLAVINDLLDIAKLEAGKVELEEIDFDLADTIEGAVEMVAGRAHEKGLEVAVDIPAALRGQWRGDPTRIAQLVLNLAGNAVKFTDRGHVVVAVEAVGEAASQTRSETGGQTGRETGRETGGEARMRLSVADTGPGLDTATVDRLFQKFTQADSSITRRYGGTGLGLAIAKHIAELMGGGIGVDTRPGEGATFWVELPLRRAADAGPAQAARLTGRRALVVDDIAVNRTIFLRQLRDLGLQADAAEDAYVANAMIERAEARGQPYDLVLVDQMLPMVSGIAFTRRLRQAGELAATPPTTRFVLASSSGQPLQAEERGLFDAVLSKPVRHRTLATALSRALTGEVAGAFGPAQAAAEGGSGHLLLAEDNPINREIALRMLEKAGFTVQAVPDGPSAVAAVSQGGFAAVLMDIEMPGMDGVEATRRIRTLPPPLGEVPVIALTAHAMAGMREKLLAAGMSDYLSKPFRPAELVEKLRAAIGGGRGAAQLIDSETAEALAGLPESDRQAIFGAFLQETGQQLARLTAALAAGRAEVVRAEAHRMVGGSAACGALRLSGLARQIEQLAGRDDMAGIAPLAEALRQEIVPSTTALAAALSLARK